MATALAPIQKTEACNVLEWAARVHTMTALAKAQKSHRDGRGGCVQGAWFGVDKCSGLLSTFCFHMISGPLNSCVSTLSGLTLAFFLQPIL